MGVLGTHVTDEGIFALQFMNLKLTRSLFASRSTSYLFFFSVGEICAAFMEDTGLHSVLCIYLSRKAVQ